MSYYKIPQLYTSEGWIDIKSIVEYDPENLCFIYIVLGRGTGKTFTTLDYCARDRAERGLGQFIYMRRTQEQCDMISNPDYTPFNDLNKTLGTDYFLEKVTKKSSGIFHSETNKDGIVSRVGSPIGFTAALSTFRNMRGLSLTGVSIMVYDEFVPEAYERPLKGEGYILRNAYETVNRNREMIGDPPLILLCLGNADDLANPVFVDLGWADRAEWMVRNGREAYFDYGRRTAIYIPKSSPISQKKEGTALYAMSGEDTFSKMALKNQFRQEGLGNVKSRPIKEYRPIVRVGDITIYRHKDRPEFYVSPHPDGSPDEYPMEEMELARFRRKYMYLWEAYMRDRITFESYMSMRIFEMLFTG